MGDVRQQGRKEQQRLRRDGPGEESRRGACGEHPLRPRPQRSPARSTAGRSGDAARATPSRANGGAEGEPLRRVHRRHPHLAAACAGVPADPVARSSLRRRRPLVVGPGSACHSAGGREAAWTPRHGTHRTPSDLQPRQLRARAPAALPDHRPSSGRCLSRPHGPDPLRLADHRQLRFQIPGRLRARARRDQSCATASTRRSGCTSAWNRRSPCAARSCGTPPTSSIRTCFWSIKNRSACAARCARR